jgi:hypothetical protein
MSHELLARLVRQLDMYEDAFGFGFTEIETYPHEELILTNLLATIAKAREATKDDKA